MESNLLSDPAYFHCVAHACVMRKTACVAQQIYVRTVTAWERMKDGNRHRKCEGCGQGQTIMRETEEAPVKEKTVRKPVTRRGRKRVDPQGNVVGIVTSGPPEEEKSGQEEREMPESKPKNEFDTGVYVDFRDYPEVLEKLREEARNEVRSMEQQVIKVLKDRYFPNLEFLRPYLEPPQVTYGGEFHEGPGLTARATAAEGKA